MLSLRSFHGGTDFPHMSPVQTVRSPLPSTQIKRRSPNETQMWNVSAQLDLRQLGLRGRLFPESRNIHETISITPLWPESAKRCRLDWKGNASTHLSVYFEKSAPTQGETTRWRNEGICEKGHPDADILKVALQPIKIAAGFGDLQVVGA